MATIVELTNVNKNTDTPVISVAGGLGWAVDLDWTASAFAAKTWASGVKAGLVIDQTGGGGGKLTLAADLQGVEGNYIQLSLTAGGTAGSEVVSRTGAGTLASPYVIDVSIQSGVSTAAQVKTKLDASALSSGLIDTTVTTAGAMSAAVAAALTGGTASGLSLTNGNITISSHGYVTGTKVTSAKGGATAPDLLPDGTYYVIMVDTNTIRLASSYANAVAGTAIVPTTYGTASVNNTLTPAALVSSFKLQSSVNGTVWHDVTGATQDLSTTGKVLFDSKASANYPIGVGYLKGVVTQADGAGAILTLNVRANTK